MKLWFENSNREERLIADCATWSEVDETINDFIKNCNDRKIAEAMDKYGEDFKLEQIRTSLFTRYYTRVWEQKDGRTRIDVGSHYEFFIWEGKYGQ